MSHTITDRSDSAATLEIKLDAEALKPHVTAAYDRLRPKVKAAGFRPGKAPDNIVERELGANAVQSEVIDLAVSRGYSQAVLSENLPVLGQPEIELKSFVPYTELTFTAKIALLPPVKLGDYKAIKKPLKPVKIAAKDVDAVIDDLLQREAKRMPALRAAEIGDEMKFDFDGVKGGEPVPGASAKGYSLKLGSGQFIPGFEEELVGLKTGESKSFDITFPKNYHETSLAGEVVTFTVKVGEVTELQAPKLDDEFVASVSPFKTVAELRKDVEEQMQAEKQAEAKRALQNEIIEELITKSKLEVPQKLIDQQREQLKAELQQRVAQAGMTMEVYLQSQSLTEEAFDKQLTPEAEKRVKAALVMTEVAKAEKLEVAKSEIDAEIENMRQRYTDPHVLEHLDHDHTRDDVYNNLMSNKVVDKLTEYATKN